jgi:hypothetical protein
VPKRERRCERDVASRAVSIEEGAAASSFWLLECLVRSGWLRKVEFVGELGLRIHGLEYSGAKNATIHGSLIP